jgi:uncharacterized protein
MTLAAVLIGGGCLAQSVPPPVAQVSADCTAPVYATDLLVCSDPALRALDAQMLRLWVMAEGRHRLDDAERAAQAEWFHNRSLCAFEADHHACAVAAYQSQISALLALLDAKLNRG